MFYSLLNKYLFELFCSAYLAAYKAWATSDYMLGKFFQILDCKTRISPRAACALCRVRPGVFCLPVVECRQYWPPVSWAGAVRPTGWEAGCARHHCRGDWCSTHHSCHPANGGGMSHPAAKTHQEPLCPGQHSVTAPLFGLKSEQAGRLHYTVLANRKYVDG